jgi:XTP/dITP diphosphohydrolase
MKLVFATNNQHKLNEVKQLLSIEIQLLSLKDIGCFDEIIEYGKTLDENAIIKSRYIYNNYKYNCFSDDTGLEVEALNMEPGVYSSRYSGDNADAEKNMKKLLENLKDEQNRNAQFRTVISLIIDKVEYKFEGICKGKITTNKIGGKGFGYDPIFKPNGFDKTFAEMTSAEKGKISHRGKAIQKLVNFLINYKRSSL